MAYEEPAPAAPEQFSYADEGKKWTYHLEGLIPIILIVIIALFLTCRFGIIGSSVPVLGTVCGALGSGTQPAQVLIIGTPSPNMVAVFNADQDLLRYRIKTADSLDRNPEAQLSQYDIIILDQSNQATKEVSRQLGDAIQKYVKTGGKLITVRDSGIRRPDSPDVVGWVATFGDVIPVDCSYVGILNQPACTQRIVVRGRIFSQDTKHKIMQGFEQVPAEGINTLLLMEALDVTPNGKELAYMEDARTGKTYTAIVEKPLVVGKSLYFNYDPGDTPGILEATIRYLR